MSLLTLDKLKDKRFYATEKAIFHSVAGGATKEIEMITVTAKISRATFYRHHEAAHTIEGDYERLVEMWVRGLVKRMSASSNGQKKVGANNNSKRGLGVGSSDVRILRKVYFELLFFMYKHRELFSYFLMRENTRVYSKIIKEAKPLVMNIWRAARWMEGVYEIYAGEVVGVMVRWGMDGFPEEEMMEALDNIMYLTVTAKERLGRFAR